MSGWVRSGVLTRADKIHRAVEEGGFNRGCSAGRHLRHCALLEDAMLKVQHDALPQAQLPALQGLLTDRGLLRP